MCLFVCLSVGSIVVCCFCIARFVVDLKDCMHVCLSDDICCQCDALWILEFHMCCTRGIKIKGRRLKITSANETATQNAGLQLDHRPNQSSPHAGAVHTVARKGPNLPIPEQTTQASSPPAAALPRNAHQCQSLDVSTCVAAVIIVVVVLLVVAAVLFATSHGVKHLPSAKLHGSDARSKQGINCRVPLACAAF